ncbi:MAG: hypothetical protein JXA96_15610 [Sedimentisphaerales bacterium]|nr:hypothetical protein [Sedimentisphaerales bacterium]
MNYADEINRYYEAYNSILKKPESQLAREDRYPFAEMIIREVFSAKSNTFAHIYQKVVLLNALYSTNIFATFDVALNIFRIDNFSYRVANGDLSLVDDIRKNQIGDSEKDFYSFATKYCHHHNPCTYPIYDSLVEDMLVYYLSEIEPDKRVYRSKMKEYPYFKSNMDHLASLWNLGNEFLYLKLDKYLWQKGKEGL